MSLYQYIMGRPWVYDRLRPMVIGGFNYSAVYAWLQCTEEDIVLDVGCGTGHAMEFLDKFKAYHGFDIDSLALDAFRLKYPDRKIELYAHILSREDVQRLRPNKVVAIGLLHHLTDGEASDLLNDLSGCDSVRRIITLDTVYLPGKWSSNFLAFMDRGRHTRKQDGYRALANNAGLNIAREELVTSGNRLAWYHAMCLERK
jgi:SAM-dependent methyltransferase